MYSLAKYKNKWAVYDSVSRVFYFIGSGKAFCQKKVNELNKGI